MVKCGTDWKGTAFGVKGFGGPRLWQVKAVFCGYPYYACVINKTNSQRPVKLECFDIRSSPVAMAIRQFCGGHLTILMQPIFIYSICSLESSSLTPEMWNSCIFSLSLTILKISSSLNWRPWKIAAQQMQARLCLPLSSCTNRYQDDKVGLGEELSCSYSASFRLSLLVWEL